MTRNSLLTAAVLAASLAVAAVPAQAAPPVSRRLEHQRQLIAQYTRTGALTSREARELRAREDRIALRADRARMDGRLTHAEHARLERELNRQYRMIHRLAHNGQRR